MKTGGVIRKTFFKKDCNTFPKNRGRGEHAKMDNTCVKHYPNMKIYEIDATLIFFKLF